MEHRLSFASVKLINPNIAEVIVDAGVIVSMEMVEEYEAFLGQIFQHEFALLVNKINPYDYSFEAKLSIGSHEKLKAIAVVYYNETAEKKASEVANLRQVDGWNVRFYSGLELGWQEGVNWLEEELKQAS
ncbi:hypothetical protein [Litorilituus lipolyticus]|uniref:STAS/SEC14 domain-containing protein n=1 Tax=Litorilituus lipolyticus TaxID=2491017 RepID=A0A502L4H8_9GAMM|nr:hypothetical protein [Litorilituus lipolyticus]TPH17829.1 hypothetical protein EPA86_04585 [Litorilituus lipolyticus]